MQPSDFLHSACILTSYLTSLIGDF
jgi:hypothetical protein